MIWNSNECKYVEEKVSKKQEMLTRR